MHEIDPTNSFRWLHFSDIHVGMGVQVPLWPRFDTLLLDDLEIACRKTGGIDLIVFSGDLTQTGSADEFLAFDKIMDRILERLEQLGSAPKIVSVPGNHDLKRPDKMSPSAVALAQFWREKELQRHVWEDDNATYRIFLAEVFSNYSEWQRRSIERGIHLAPEARGLLPGDASYIVEAGAGRLGIIGLNSTWLQLGGGDYRGELHVDPRQLHAVTDGLPDDWIRKNDANLLVTHHPEQWLKRDASAAWNNDINPAGRFDLHLFGHMHDPNVSSISHGGGLPRRHVQAASLFGMETFGDDEERIQGCSVNRISVEGTERVLTSWPRRLLQVAGGRAKLVPDSSQDIDEETGSFSIPYRVERATHSASPLLAPLRPRPSVAPLAPATFDLLAIQHPVGEARAHQKVRKVEQQSCIAALREKRASWLVSDWGMGKEGFIAAICGQLGVSNERVYSLDFNRFPEGDAFFDSLRTRLGASFQQICEAIADAGRSILILDDVDVAASPPGTEAAIETLVAPVSDFAAEAYILIRSRRRPRLSTLPVVELKALDEADVAIYARESEIGGERYAKPDAVSKLYRHTDGIPTRIDDALRDLEILSLGDLISANPDFGDAGLNIVSAPPALVSTVRELEQSDDRAEERAYSLLLALSSLPQGEQLARLKRFLGPHPFHPSHARALLERSLIDTVTLTALDGMPGDTTNKALVVPRPVREYIRSIIDETTAKSFDRKALQLYFGEGWSSGNIRNSPTGRRVRAALCDGYEIQNASTLILRTARRAIEEDSQLEVSGSIRLASAFIEVLISGDHYRAAAALSEDMIRLLEEGGNFEKELNVLRYELARSLRMAGRLADSREAFEQLDLGMLSLTQRQSAELGLALNLERSGDDIGATEAAKRAIAIDRSSNIALHARAILAGQIDNDSSRVAELQKLLSTAKRKGATVLANNIMIDLAREPSVDRILSADLLKEILQNQRTKPDFYNSARAIVALASVPGAAVKLTDDERDRLISAYHYLYNERLSDLFDRCHAALWNIFESKNDTANLLNLFRHSSFIWRLSGREDQEAKYLSKLLRMVHSLLEQGVQSTSRDGAYFVVRVSVVMRDQSDDKPIF